MKKILIVAALLATCVMPATSASAADAAMAAPAKPSLSCFLLPLLPDCLSAWKAEHDSLLAKITAPAPKTVALAAPKLPAMPSCTKAAAGEGHLYDCKM